MHYLAHVGVEVGGEGGAGHDDGDARHHRLARLGSGEGGGRAGARARTGARTRTREG